MTVRHLAGPSEPVRPGLELLARFRISRGDTVRADEYYFRTACRFESGDRRYSWLARAVVVGSGSRVGDVVVYDAFTVT